LSDRIWVLSRRPSQIIRELKIDFSRPRNQVSTRAEARFMELRNDIYRQIGNKSEP
jgi:ABC-type nitrate/sulfonate/bicarbonate transport system ATPase subunit